VKRVLLLLSDTGGGHRAAAEAIRAALYLLYGEDAVAVTLVDVFRQIRFPLNRAPELYHWMIQNSQTTWGIGYRLLNIQSSTRLFTQGVYQMNHRRLREMIQTRPADVVVSVHSVITRPAMAAFRALPRRPPFITVVTDLVSTPTFWYEQRVEHCFVPTQAAYDRGVGLDMKPEKMEIVGLPVHPQFGAALQPKEIARRELGWEATTPVILLVAGSEGMGALLETARAINEQRLPCQLAIVTGRNVALKQRLEAAEWNQPTYIYGFVTDMSLKMSAADILVTKAGPATISEACLAGLPMILCDAIPGQETGNVHYVVENNAGVFAPNPVQVAQMARAWLEQGPAYWRERGENARRLARPNAAEDIARAVWRYAHYPPIVNEQRHWLADLAKIPLLVRRGLPRPY